MLRDVLKFVPFLMHKFENLTTSPVFNAKISLAKVYFNTLQVKSEVFFAATRPNVVAMSF